MKKLSYAFAFVITFSTGLCDAYSYLLRDGAFSGMQTGNILKLTIAILETKNVLKYAMPILSFIAGIFTARALALTKNGSSYCLTLQTLLAVVTFFVPCGEYGYNVLGNCLLSVACAVVFESFGECNGRKYTAVMCTNNLRLFSESLFDFTFKGKRKTGSAFYLFVIASFASGCLVGKVLVDAIGTYTVLVLAGVYAVLIIIDLFLRKESCNIRQC